MLLYLLQGVALAFSATVTPGPLQAFLFSSSLRNGWKRTLPAALAPLVTDGPILSLLLLLLSNTPQWFLEALRIGGGLFILYLAGGVFRTLRRPGTAFPLEEGATRKSFFSAIAINALNPNPYIFWGTVGGPIVLGGWRESPELGISFLVGFFGTFVLGLGLLILAFSSAGKLDPKVTRMLSGIACAALLAFGLYQISLGARAVFMQ